MPCITGDGRGIPSGCPGASAIKTWVNGTPVADLTDTESKMPTGFIGLQVHGIGRGAGPYLVQWRNIYLKDLSGTH